MSYIFVNTGQCGNQLGCSMMDSLYQQLQSDPFEMDAHFRTVQSKGETKTFARAVCIDTEPKVINDCIQRVKDRKSWIFDNKSIVYGHGGAGNNWALGYETCGGEFLDASLDGIRRELEMCNRPPSLLITHSVAGGTGSGCGTRITESAADEFPDVMRINIAVTPYHFGEVVVQHFNTILSLSKLSGASDGIIAFENEVAKQLCIEMKGIGRPSMHDINEVIAANILPALLPKYPYIHDRDADTSPSTKYSTRKFSTISDDVGELCCHPGYRFLNVKNIPQTSERSVAFTYDSWSSLVETLMRMDQRGNSSDRGAGSRPSISTSSKRSSMDVAAPSDDMVREGSESHFSTPVIGFRSLKSVLTVRGPDAASGLAAMHAAATAASGAYLPQRRSSTVVAPDSSVFDDMRCDIHHSSRTVNGYHRSAVLLSNSQAILPILQRAALKGADMYRARAYVHQYKSCGLEDDDFVRAFRTVGQVIENYRGL